MQSTSLKQLIDLWPLPNDSRWLLISFSWIPNIKLRCFRLQERQRRWYSCLSFYASIYAYIKHKPFYFLSVLCNKGIPHKVHSFIKNFWVTTMVSDPVLSLDFVQKPLTIPTYPCMPFKSSLTIHPCIH